MFNLSKYLGTWYELAHYPSWFQRNDNFNTTAEYSLNADGTVAVHNSTLVPGAEIKRFDSYGTATPVTNTTFQVQFSMPEVSKLAMSGEFKPPSFEMVTPNYVIDRLWTDVHGNYVFAVVTDAKKQSLYVLSRCAWPSLAHYAEVMCYVVNNYDRDRLVQVTHYE